jgi:hypothetical protein
MDGYFAQMNTNKTTPREMLPYLLYQENAPFIFNRDQPLMSEREIRYNLRATIAQFKGDSIGRIVVYLITLVFWACSLASIYVIFEMVAHILAGEFVFQATGVILIVLFALSYILRFGVVYTYFALFQTWFSLDKNSEEHLYRYLTKRGKLSTGRVINVVGGYESSGVYFSYNKFKNVRYFSSKPAQIGSQVVVLHNWIVAVVI